MQKSVLSILLLFLTTSLGCSGLKVSEDYEPGTDFSGLTTYAWKTEAPQKTGDVRVDNPFMHQRIRTAVERSLGLKGFRKSDGGSPDFLVDYQYTIRSKITSQGVSTGFGIGTGGSGGFGGIGVSSGGDVKEVDEGALVIDVIDAGNGKLLWRGTGMRTLSSNPEPQKTTQTVNETVEKILAQFPPGKK